MTLPHAVPWAEGAVGVEDAAGPETGATLVGAAPTIAMAATARDVVRRTITAAREETAANRGEYLRC
ncbi:unnamed protein product [Rhizoctonia solani]|uniref:Uncharacterized protein n=1 Tax=Rhizoctonia solani TaxID=456999 RepID=A0A8H3D2E7_9AGAM|nr:unnamed protein product [Rhizoctonia solani]